MQPAERGSNTKCGRVVVVLLKKWTKLHCYCYKIFGTEEANCFPREPCVPYQNDHCFRLIVIHWFTVLLFSVWFFSLFSTKSDASTSATSFFLSYSSTLNPQGPSGFLQPHFQAVCVFLQTFVSWPGARLSVLLLQAAVSGLLLLLFACSTAWWKQGNRKGQELADGAGGEKLFGKMVEGKRKQNDGSMH